ncbi:MAG: hypothetical protein ABSC94_28545 [Polyangiaceae bacterium]
MSYAAASKSATLLLDEDDVEADDEDARLGLDVARVPDAKLEAAAELVPDAEPVADAEPAPDVDPLTRPLTVDDEVGEVSERPVDPAALAPPPASLSPPALAPAVSLPRSPTASGGLAEGPR